MRKPRDVYFTPPESVGVPTTWGPLAKRTLWPMRSANVHVICPLSGIEIFAVCWMVGDGLIDGVPGGVGENCYVPRRARSCSPSTVVPSAGSLAVSSRSRLRRRLHT